MEISILHALFYVFTYGDFSPLQSRPFGVSLLIAGHDEKGPSL